MRYSFATRLIHGRSKSRRWDYKHHVVPPISASTTYRLDSTERGAQGFIAFANAKLAGTQAPIYIYDRLDEPTRGILEEALADAEEAETALTFSTGMAAVAAAFGITVKSGERVLAHRLIYGCTYSLLTHWFPRMGIAVDFVDMSDLKALEKAIRRETRVLYFETPVNPTLQILDIRAIHAAAKRANARRKDAEKIEVVIDNTFATPFCQRPLNLGADIVVHSLTKGIGGFGTDMGGAIMTKGRYHDSLLLYRKDFGGVLAPKSAWEILTHGLPTLALRMKRQQETALRVAEFLADHDKVAKVAYPGLHDFPGYDLARRQMTDPEGNFAPGSIVYFELKGSREKARRAGKRLCDALGKRSYTVTLAVSLGQIRTLVESPDLMTHSALSETDKAQAGLGHGGVRLSIGCEEPHDILHDLSRALKQV